MIRGRPHETFYVIPVNDDAIDRESFEGQLALRTYMKERDPEVLRLLPFSKPTRFKCRPMAHQARLAIEGEENAALRHTQAFHACVEGAENLVLPDGTAWIPKRIAASYEVGAYVLADESVKELGNAGLGKVIEEVGYVCLQRANLTAEQGKAYRLPLGFTVSWQPSSSATTRDTSGTETPPSGST